MSTPLPSLFFCAVFVVSFSHAADTPDLHPQLIAAQLAENCARAYATALGELRGALNDRRQNALARLVRIETSTGDYYDGIVDAVLLNEVSPDAKVHDTASTCVQRFSDQRTDIDASPDVYALANAAAKFAKSQDDRQLIKLYQEAGRRSGAQLPAPRRAEVTRWLKQLDALGDAFEQRLMQDRSTITISMEESASLPAPFVATLEKTSAGYVVPVGLRTHDTFLKNEASADARRRFLAAYFQVGMPENAARVREALALRRRIAAALGYASWDQYQLQVLMAQSPQRALKLIGAVDAALRSRADDEISTLAAFKAAQGDASPIAAWDYTYFEEQFERAHYSVSSEEVRRYFPANKFIPATLGIYAHLFGLRFKKAPNAPTWAAGVEGYAVVDAASGKTLAWMYLDLLPRAGKFTRPANFALRPGHRRADGTYTLPISMIYGAGPAPAPGQPALFTHHDVVEFFHEFGHVMHTSLGTTPYWRLYSVGVRADFIEAPSQMLENWMWQPSVLKRISSHVDTGAPIPDALIKRLLALKHVADGVFWTRQAFLAAFDLALHGERDPGDADALWISLMPRWTPLPPLAGAKPSASFLPLFGYDASYYGYLWSRVAAQDMFSIFERDGLDNAAVGMRYRRDILESVGSEEPERLIERFLGRPMRYDAFYHEISGGSIKAR